MKLTRNPRRDPRAIDFGTYMLIDANGALVQDFGWDHARHPEGASWLDDIERYLTSDQ